MSVTVLGSLNEDVLIAVARLPRRGETVVVPAGPRPGRPPGGLTAGSAAPARGTGRTTIPRGGLR